jgi:hypothetical protein
MIDSQSKIIERLQMLNLDDEIKQFIVEIMEFYKGHIKKLQGIIMTKQSQIEEALQTKTLYEDKIEALQYELAQIKAEPQMPPTPPPPPPQPQFNQDYRNLEMTIESLKCDLADKLFEKNVYEDDIRNLKAQNDILLHQNSLMVNQCNDLKAEIAMLKNQLSMKSVVPTPAMPSHSYPVNVHNDPPQHLINQINSFKTDLHNAMNTPSNSGNARENIAHSQINTANQSDVPSKRGGRQPRYYENDDSAKINQSMNKTDSGFYNQGKVGNNLSQSMPPQVESNPPKPEILSTNAAELESYLKFLTEKEREIQDKLWKLPQKARSKVDKVDRREAEKQHEEVSTEIERIRVLLKRN